MRYCICSRIFLLLRYIHLSVINQVDNIFLHKCEPRYPQYAVTEEKRYKQMFFKSLSAKECRTNLKEKKLLIHL